MKFTYRDIPITYKGISETTYEINGENERFSNNILLEIPGDKLEIAIEYGTRIHFSSFELPDSKEDGKLVHTLRTDFQNFITFLFTKSPLRVLLMIEFPEMSLTLNKEGSTR